MLKLPSLNYYLKLNGDLLLSLQIAAARLRWDVWEREKQRKKEAEELAWVLTHPVLRGPNGERVAGPAFEPPVPRPPRKH